MLEKIFGIVLANKIEIAIKKLKEKNKIIKSIISGLELYFKTIVNSSNEWKIFIVAGTLLNIWIFSGFLPFIICVIIDSVIYYKVTL